MDHTFNITEHLQALADGHFTVFTVHRLPQTFIGRYSVPGCATDFPFRYHPGESVRTLLRLKHIDDVKSDGQTLKIAQLKEHPRVYEDLQKVWYPFEDFFSHFEKHIRDNHNFAQQVLTDMAALVLQRKAVYTQNRFTREGFAGLPWLGMMLHYEARRDQPNNLDWIEEAYRQQIEQELGTPRFLMRLITSEFLQPCL